MQENKRMGTRLGLLVYGPDAAQMPLFAGKRCGKPCFNRVFRLLEREETQSEAKRIGIVVFAGRRKNVELLAACVYLLHARITVVKRAAHACEPVGDHRLALPGGTRDDCAAVHTAPNVLGELLCCGGDDGGIVVRLVEGMRSAILYLIA